MQTRLYWGPCSSNVEGRDDKKNGVSWLLMEVPNGGELVPLTEHRKGYVPGSGWRRGLGAVPILEVVLCARGSHSPLLLLQTP